MARTGREEPADLAQRGDPEADPRAAAREIALRQLTVRARSRAELERALRTRGVPDDVAQGVLDRFSEVGLVDDADFATQWVAAGLRRQRSKVALRHELQAKGVDDDTVQHALEAVSDDAEWGAALALARKRLSANRGLAAAVRERRALAALARRGFPAQVAYRAVREAAAELES